MRGCKEKCNMNGVVRNLGRGSYIKAKVGHISLVCRSCEIIIPNNHTLIKFDIIGGKRCSCCGSKLSGKMKDRSRGIHRTQLELEGLLKRY